MFKITLQIVFLIYILIVIYNIIHLQKYNINGFTIQTNEENILRENLTKLNPIIFHKDITFQIEEIDSFNDIINYKNNLPNYVYKHNGIINNFDVNYFFNCSIFDDSYLLFPMLKYITIIHGKNTIPLKKCIHNRNIIGILDGSTTIYLFNPKHKEEIINKKKKSN
tara:strand:+ start:610 stop:1107 length:498 start_codon:yes stop_codon:yes gene_type:complete